MKICKELNCDNSVFGGDYCKYHQYRRSMQGGDKYKAGGRIKSKPRRRTPKREKDERYYAVQAREFFEESDKICIFCGVGVTKFQGLHHWKGRTNDYLLDKQWWSVVHNKCHVYIFHRCTSEQLQEQWWYEEFVARLKIKSIELYNKITGRGEKIHRLNPLPFKEEEDLF